MSEVLIGDVPGEFVSPGVSPDAAVLLLHGTASQRDEVGGLYARLAVLLAARGIASLRIDFAGCGASARPQTDYSITSELADGRAALAWLRAEASVSRVSVLGMSQGGMIALLLAASDPSLSGLVTWSAGVLTPSELSGAFPGLLADGAPSAVVDLGYRKFEFSRQWLEEFRSMDLAGAALDLSLPLLAVVRIRRRSGRPSCVAAPGVGGGERGSHAGAAAGRGPRLQRAQHRCHRAAPLGCHQRLARGNVGRVSNPPITETLAQASHLLGRPLTLIDEPLPSGSRHLVLRVRSGDETSAIVKRRLDPSPSPEASALSVMGDSSVTPALIAATPELLIMEDLGNHPHLASLLLGNDPLAARDGVLAWARGLGALHRAGLDARARFLELMPEYDDYMPALLNEATDDLATWAAELEVAVPGGFSSLTDITFAAPLQVLSAGDMCPDNNLVFSGQVRFIDLEFATVRHAAWDLAYLLAPWPSCWCAWRLPPELVDAALASWRTGFGAVDWPELERDLRLATEAWRWLAVSWLLPSLATGWPERPERPAPPVANRIVDALDELSMSAYLPELRDTAMHLAVAIRAKHSVGRLGVARAWR